MAGGSVIAYRVAPLALPGLPNFSTDCGNTTGPYNDAALTAYRLTSNLRLLEIGMQVVLSSRLNRLHSTSRRTWPILPVALQLSFSCCR